MNYNTDNPKFHEEVFNAVGDIVHDCYNYLSEEEAQDLEVIYAIGSSEGWLSFRLFFKINNKLFEIHQIKDKADDPDAQIGIQQSGTEFLEHLSDIFKSYDQPVPTQIKIQFDAKAEKVDYQFQYELLWSNDEDKLSSDLYDEYFEEIKNTLENK